MRQVILSVIVMIRANRFYVVAAAAGGPAPCQARVSGAIERVHVSLIVTDQLSFVSRKDALPIVRSPENVYRAPTVPRKLGAYPGTRLLAAMRECRWK